MTETSTTTIPSRIARCADADDSETYRISGEAIAHQDVTRGLERTRKVWLAEHLRPAAETLEGAPITPLHSEQEVGEVTAAGWDPTTESVVWEAEITDASLAQQVADGDLEVSIEASHYDGGTHEATGAMVAADVRFTGLSLVQRGSAPSASAEAGPAQSAALSARLSAAQIEATLADDEIDAEALADELEDAIDPAHIFRNPNQAVGKAEEMGLDDIHEHDVDGTPVYMPGESHDALLDYLQDDAQAAETTAVEATLADGVAYETTNVGPDDIDEWTDAEWDGDAVIADLPNPSDSDDAATVLDQTHAVVPADDARENKANWKAPFRTGPDAAVNTRALVAIDGALSGARGGFDGLDDNLESDLSDWTQSMLAAAPEDLHGSTDEAEAAGGEVGFPANVFEVHPPAHEESEFDSSLLGIGVEFPNSGVYVDWRNESFPDELDKPHVSIYGSVADLQKATGNRIELVAHTESELAAATSEQFQATLAAVSDDAAAADPPEDAEAAHGDGRDLMKDPEQGDIVSWNSQGGRPAAGRVIETIGEGRYDTELSGDATVNAPAALIRLHRPTDDGWHRTDVTVAHRTDGDTLRVRDDWPAVTEAILAQYSDERAESRDTDSDADTPTPAMSNEDDTTPDDPDDPADPTELKAKLSDKSERIDELEAELADVREERDEYERQADAVDEAEGAFAAALADHVPRDAEALQADLSLSQMRDWLDDIEEADVGDAATTDPEPQPQAGGGEGETATLSEPERERKQEIESRLAELEDRDGPLAQAETERLESELADLTEA